MSANTASVLASWLRKLARAALLSVVIFSPTLYTTNASAAGDRLQVVFVQPGSENDPFWSMTSDFAYAAANRLNIDLKIFFSRGDDTIMKKIVTAVVTSPDKPDFLMLTNYHGLAPDLLAIASKNKVPSLLVIDGLTEKELPHMEQTVLNNMVGSMVADYRTGAYNMARNLLQVGTTMSDWKNNFAFHFIAINGDLKWPMAHNVELGILDALEEYPLVIMDGVVYGDWSADKAKSLMVDAYKKHQEINFIWAASDGMANAALAQGKEIQATDPKVTKNQLLVAGMGWTPDGLNALEKGDFVVDYGGSFMLGGFGLVVLRDVADGHKFPIISKLWLMDYPVAMNQSGLIDFRKRFPQQNWERINFAALSKSMNNQVNGYDFSLQGIYSNVDKEMQKRAAAPKPNTTPAVNGNGNGNGNGNSNGNGNGAQGVNNAPTP